MRDGSMSGSVVGMMMTTMTARGSASKWEKATALFEGCLVFDEAHQAKNLESGTKTAQLVVLLQDVLYRGRVVYCSATGVSDLGYLVYATRLGLWDNKPLNTDFESFKNGFEERGVDFF